MIEDVITRYLHVLGFMTLFAALVAEHLFFKREMTPAEIKRMAVLDAIYGVAAAIVIATGFILWFGVGKPADFYTKNPIFHVKFTLFFLVAALSLYPTYFFIRHRQSTENVIAPKAVIMLIRAELALLLLIPLMAVLMALGIGLSR